MAASLAGIPIIAAAAPSAVIVSVSAPEWTKFQEVYDKAIADAHSFMKELNNRTARAELPYLQERRVAIINNQAHLARRSKLLTTPADKERAAAYIAEFTPLIKIAKLKVPCIPLIAGFSSLKSVTTAEAFQLKLKETLRKLEESLPFIESVVDPRILDPEVEPMFAILLQTLQENTTELLIEGVPLKDFLLFHEEGVAKSHHILIDRLKERISRASAHISEASFFESIRLKIVNRPFLAVIEKLNELQSTNTPLEFQSKLRAALEKAVESLTSLAKVDDPRTLDPPLINILNSLMSAIETNTTGLFAEGVLFRSYIQTHTEEFAAETPVILDELIVKMRRIIAFVLDEHFLDAVNRKLILELSNTAREEMEKVPTVDIYDLPESIPRLLNVMECLANLLCKRDNPSVLDLDHAEAFKALLDDFNRKLTFILIEDKTLPEFMLHPEESTLETGGAAASAVAATDSEPAFWTDAIVADLNLLRRAAANVTNKAHLISRSIVTADSEDHAFDDDSIGHVSDFESK